MGGIIELIAHKKVAASQGWGNIINAGKQSQKWFANISGAIASIVQHPQCFKMHSSLYFF